MTGSLLVWFATSGAALAAPAEPGPGPVSVGEIRQDVLPELRARLDRAQARTRGAEQWFAGTAVLDEAFPELAGAALFDATFVTSRLVQLDRRAEQRGSERVVADLELPGQLGAELALTRQRALDAEEAADQLERRMLTSILAGLSRAPLLAESLFASRVAQWRRVQEEALAEGAPPQAADRAAQAASAELEALDVRQRALRAMTVPGDGALRTWTEAIPAEGAIDPERARTARTVLPLLPETVQTALVARVDEFEQALQREQTGALEARRAALQAALDEPVGSLDATVEELQAAVGRAEPLLEQARAASEAAPDDAVAAMTLEVATLELTVAQRQLEAAQRAPSSQAQHQAEAAREALEKTRQAALYDEKLAPVREKVARLQTELAEVLEAEAARHEVVEQRLGALRADLDQKSEQAAAALSLPPLDGQRRSQIDSAFLGLRQTVSDLYAFTDELRATRSELRADASARTAAIEPWAAGTATHEVARLASAFAEAGSQLDEALRTRSLQIDGDIDATYRLLDLARDERRRVRADASSAALTMARRDFFPELSRELEAIPSQLVSQVRGLVVGALALPTLLMDLTALWELVVSSFELVVLVAIWGFAHRLARTGVERGLAFIEQRGTPVEGNRDAFVDDVTRWVQLGADLLVAGLLVAWLTPVAPPLGLAALCWFGWTLWTWAPLMARCTLSTPDELHPSLRLVTEPTERLAVRSLSAVAVWWAVTRLLTYTSVHLLDADRLRDVISALASAAMWLILAGLVVAWGPAALDAVAGGEDQNRLTRWLAARRGTGLVRRIWNLPAAVFALVYLAGREASGVTRKLVESSSGLGWIASALARRQLKSDVADEATVEVTPAPPECHAAIDVARQRGIDRPEAVARLVEAHAGWRRDSRRGLVSLVGERGSGKPQLLARLPAILGPEQTIRRLEVPGQMISASEALDWLAGALGLEPGQSADALGEAVAALPGQVLVLEDAHRLFLRVVKGYAALQSLMSVMVASSNTHFWVLTAHAPTWDYLTGIAARLNLDAFRDHIRLEPLTGTQLADWLEGAVDRPISYALLATTGVLGGDPTLAERRARAAYWRLLGEASRGIPAVAALLFENSLVSGADGGLEVRWVGLPSADDIDTSSDEVLFALTALVQHNGLGSEQLALVLNRRPGAARSLARHLQGIGVVAFDPARHRYVVELQWEPAVQQLLRRKHFLHWN